LANYPHEAEYRLREANYIYKKSGHRRLELSENCLRILEGQKIKGRLFPVRSLAAEMDTTETDCCDIYWLLKNVDDLGEMIRFGHDSAKRHDVI